MRTALPEIFRQFWVGPHSGLMRAEFFTEGAKVLKFSLRGPLDEKTETQREKGGKERERYEDGL